MKQEIELHKKTYEQLQETLVELANENYVLSKALDEACELIGELGGCTRVMYDKYISCQESCTNNPKKCWRDYLMKGDVEWKD